MITTRTYSAIITLLGICLILVSVGFMVVLPLTANLSEGYFTPIIAFELATQPDDIRFMMGESGKPLRTAMRAGLNLDTLFPFLYAAFIFFIAFQFARKGYILGWVSCAIALALPVLDLFENHAMFNILDALESQTLTPKLFTQLAISTWAKWLGIGLVLGLLAILYARIRQWTSFILCSCCFFITLAAFLLRPAPILGELMAISVSVFLLFFFIKHALRLKRTTHADSL